MPRGAVTGLFEEEEEEEARVGRVALALVSNGIGEVVWTKVDRLDLERYFDAIVVSGEVGVAKPRRSFFDITLDRLGHPDKATTLMIGDNLASDIQGGIDTCWYAPNVRTDGHAHPPRRQALRDRRDRAGVKENADGGHNPCSTVENLTIERMFDTLRKPFDQV